MKRKYVHHEEGLQLDDEFTVKCGLKEGASFLGLNVVKCTKSKEVGDLLTDQMKFWLDHISSLKYGLGARCFSTR